MSVEEALRFDEDSGTAFWQDTIKKELKNVRVAKFSDNDKVPLWYTQIPCCHVIFDVKIMMTLQQKSRLMAGGHMTDPPKENVCSSIISRDSIRLAFLSAALNDVNVLAANIQNAYLTAPTL